jgi:hypothetical protein
MEINNKYQIGQIVYCLLRLNITETMSTSPTVISGILIQDNDGTFQYTCAIEARICPMKEKELYATKELAEQWLRLLTTYHINDKIEMTREQLDEKIAQSQSE